jgi:hypothetical protein
MGGRRLNSRSSRWFVPDRSATVRAPALNSGIVEVDYGFASVVVRQGRAIT